MANKSKVINARIIKCRLTRAFNTLSEDRVTVYAAQVSFLIALAAIPFIMLLINLSRIVIPDRVYEVIYSFTEQIPNEVGSLINNIIKELEARPTLNIISATGVVALWTASRGIASVHAGIATVYKTKPTKGFLGSIVSSTINTIVFIIVVLISLVAVLFGEQLFGLLEKNYDWVTRFREVFRYRSVVLFLFMTLFFNIVFYSVNKNGGAVERKFRYHFPGAIISSAGWILFSYFYQLYTIYFSKVSFIYGSLTAIVLLMLWLYSCMTIMLLGAELNKYLSGHRKRAKKRKAIRKANVTFCKSAEDEIPDSDDDYKSDTDD